MAEIERVYALLEEVKDPEIPVLSLVDLGVITHIELHDKKVSIQLTPTFVGCPALEMMQAEIRDVLKRNGFEHVNIEVSFKKPWSSDMISEKGRDAIRRFGIAPPPAQNLFTDIGVLEHAQCPRCNGQDTELRTPFGATLCRSIHYCNTCKEAFEQFKPL